MPRMLAASRGARSRCMTLSSQREYTILTAKPIRIYSFLYGRAAVCGLVAQRLTRLQRKGNAFLRLLFSAQRHERLALEIEDVLLTHHLRSGERPPGHNVGQF